MDYSQIFTIALLVISEILPLINRVPANGILHTVKLILAYIWVKFCNQSDLAQEIEQIKSKSNLNGNAQTIIDVDMPQLAMTE